MILNRYEKVLMNNPVRAAFQRDVEAQILLSMGGRLDNRLALEIGCGRGVGMEIILDKFNAAHVDGFDLDPDMVRLAEERLASRGAAARVWQGDAESITASDGFYDAVFNFGIIHHVPNWRKALSEVFRVLKPGGKFYIEEVLSGLIDNPLARKYLDHPLADRFNFDDLWNGLSDAGFRVVASRKFFGLVAWYLAVKPKDAPAAEGVVEASVSEKCWFDQ
jgi:ubiquinone/menaquinone biosynthesis C-methylase UbiE